MRRAGDIQRILLEDVAVEISVGIADWERLRRQKVLVSVEMVSARPARWTTIADCIDYDRVHAYIVREWPKRPHTDLLETLCDELMEHVFADPKVEEARVRIVKPEVYPDTRAAGVELVRRRRKATPGKPRR